MRLTDALLRAMRTWRAGRAGQDEADRLVAGDRSSPGHSGLDHLLDALRAPGTSGELSGEREMAAALATERRRAALTTRPEERIRVRVPRTTRTTVVSIATGLAVLSVGGTAVAAGTGNLPAGLQQRAHRLFSALGIPAPRTGTTTSTTAPTATPKPAPSATASRRGETPPAPAAPSAWCSAWATAAAGGKPMNGRDRRDLIAAAGGPDEITSYCATLVPSVSPSATVKPGRGASHRATPSHPTPPGRNK